jgi:hypothetical protein
MSRLLLALILMPAADLLAEISVRTIAGDNAINNIRRTTAFEPEVEVRDATGKPISGAVVTFTLPSVGAGGTFPDGSRTLTLPTNESGRALARGLRPNQVTGPFSIRVTASFKGESASTVVRQTNAAPTAEAKPTRMILIVGLIAGAVAGGLLATQGGGSTPSSSGGPFAGDSTTTPGVITPGQPGFGPPR